MDPVLLREQEVVYIPVDLGPPMFTSDNINPEPLEELWFVKGVVSTIYLGGLTTAESS